jgi:uncharacterized protein YegP (UPF0339 family)
VTLPRIVLVTGGRGRTAPTSWPHADQVVGTAGRDGSWYGWRLLAANNRELGRSPQVHAALTECQQAAVRMVTDFEALTTVVSADSARGLWRWRLDGADSAVAVSSRLYLRQRECVYSLRQFLQAAPTAVIFDAPDAATVVVDLTGAQPVLRYGYRSDALTCGPGASR